MNEKISDGVVSTEQTEALSAAPAWICELTCGHHVPTVYAASMIWCPLCGRKISCIVAQRIYSMAEYDAIAAEVESLTQQRDSAREWAVRLEQQNAEALALHIEGPLIAVFRKSYRVCGHCSRPWPCNTQRILGAFPDDETEQQ